MLTEVTNGSIVYSSVAPTHGINGIPASATIQLPCTVVHQGVVLMGPGL